MSRRGCLPPFASPLALDARENGDGPFGGEGQSLEPPNGCIMQLPTAAAFGQDPASCYIPLRRLQDLASMINAEYLNGSKDDSDCLQEMEGSDSSLDSPELCDSSVFSDPEDLSPEQDSERLLNFEDLSPCAEEDKEMDSETSFLTEEENPEEDIKFVMKNIAATSYSKAVEHAKKTELTQRNEQGTAIELGHNETISTLFLPLKPPEQIQSNNCKESGVRSRTEKVDLLLMSHLPGETNPKKEKQFSITKASQKDRNPIELGNLIERLETSITTKPATGLPSVSSLGLSIRFSAKLLEK